MSNTYLRNICTLCLCFLLAVAGFGAFWGQSIPSSTLIADKKLPIYCVQTDSPKVAISFDAAWGNV